MYVTVSNLLACRQPHSVFFVFFWPSLIICLFLELSVCFWTPRLLLGHPDSFTSMHDLRCMRKQTIPLFNVPLGKHGTTTWLLHPYPHGISRARICNGSPEC